MKTKRYYLLFVLVIFSLTVTNLNATDRPSLNESEIENLITGIESDNNGLMRSSVYLAGKYKVREVTSSLINKLKTEEDPSDVILIAFAIYEIGDKEAVLEMLETAEIASDAKVKKMLNLIVVQFMDENDLKYVLR